MKRIWSLMLCGALLMSGTSCSQKKTLAFSLYSISELRRDATLTEFVQKKVDSWYRYAQDFMGMEIVIDQELLTGDRKAQECSKYIMRQDLADVFISVESSKSRKNLKALVQQGKIINLLDYKDYMPHYAKVLEENMNLESVSIDGKVYSFSAAVNNPAPISQYSWLYNYTAFQQNGIPLPRNLEELYTAAKKLKQIYPESDPIMFYSTDLYYICRLFGNLNRLQLLDYYNGSEFRMGLFDNPGEWKKTIAYLHRMYKEGIVNPGFDSYNTEHVEFSATSNKTFIIPQTWSGSAGELTKSGDYEWVCGNTPNGLGNQTPYFTAEQTGSTLSLDYNLCISADAKNPELLVKLIDNEYAPATMDLYNWGEEGVRYSVDENNQKHSLAENSEEYRRMKEEHPLMAVLWWNQDRGALMEENRLLNPVPTVFNDVYEKTDYWLFSKKYIRPDNVLPDAATLPGLVRSSLSDEQSEVVSRNMRTTQNFVIKNIRQFILGDKDFSTWDDFIEQAKQAGDHQSVLNIYNEQLKKFG